MAPQIAITLPLYHQHLCLHLQQPHADSDRATAAEQRRAKAVRVCTQCSDAGVHASHNDYGSF